VGLAPNHPECDAAPFEGDPRDDHGWARYNAQYWLQDYRGFLEFFFEQCVNEPHSTKQVEDAIGWALQTTPETLIDATRGLAIPRDEPFRETCRRVRCPTLVIHGDRDAVRPLAQGAALARETGGQLVTLAGSGHMPLTRDPVKVNLLLRQFIAAASRGERARC